MDTELFNNENRNRRVFARMKGKRTEAERRWDYNAFEWNAISPVCWAFLANFCFHIAWKLNDMLRKERRLPSRTLVVLFTEFHYILLGVTRPSTNLTFFLFSPSTADGER